MHVLCPLGGIIQLVSPGMFRVSVLSDQTCTVYGLFTFIYMASCFHFKHNHCVCVCTWACVCVCARGRVCVCVCVHAFMRACGHVYMHACMWSYVCAYGRVYMHACLRTYVLICSLGVCFTVYSDEGHSIVVKMTVTRIF